MTTYNHNPIVIGESNLPATVNTRLGTLDAAIGNRAGYTNIANIAAWIASLATVAGGAATLTSSAVSSGATSIPVDSTSGFVTGAYVGYVRQDGTYEQRQITVASGAFTVSAVGGAIADNTVISQLTTGQRQSPLQANYGNSYTPDVVTESTNRNASIYYARNFGFDGPGATAASNKTAIQATIDAANTAGGGDVVINGVGEYQVSDELNLKANVKLIIMPGVHLRFGASAPATSHTDAQSTTASYVIYIEGQNNWQLWNFGTIDAQNDQFAPNATVGGGTSCIAAHNCDHFYIHLGYVKNGNVGIRLSDCNYGTAEHGWSDNPLETGSARSTAQMGRMDAVLTAENAQYCLFNDIKAVDTGEGLDLNAHVQNCVITNIFGGRTTRTAQDAIVEVNMSPSNIIENVVGEDWQGDGVLISGEAGVRWSTATPPNHGNRNIVRNVRGTFGGGESIVVRLKGGSPDKLTDQAVSSTLIDGVYATQAYIGIQLDFTRTDNINYTTIRNVQLSGVSREGLYVKYAGDTSGTVRGLIVDGWVSTNVSAYNILRIEDMTEVQLSNIHVPAAATAASCIALTRVNRFDVKGVILEGGGGTQHGIVITNCRYGFIRGGVIRGFATAAKGALYFIETTTTSHILTQNILFQSNQYVAYDDTNVMSSLVIESCILDSNTNTVRTAGNYTLQNNF